MIQRVVNGENEFRKPIPISQTGDEAPFIFKNNLGALFPLLSVDVHSLGLFKSGLLWYMVIGVKSFLIEGCKKTP